MAISNKYSKDAIHTNLFNDGEIYTKNGFWLGFGSNQNLFYRVKELAAEEKAEINLDDTKPAEGKLVFKKYVSKYKVLFVLYLLGLYTPGSDNLNDSTVEAGSQA